MVGVQVFIFHGVVADLLDIVGNDDPVDHELLARGRIVGLICVPAGRFERRQLLLRQRIQAIILYQATRRQGSDPCLLTKTKKVRHKPHLFCIHNSFFTLL